MSCSPQIFREAISEFSRFFQPITKSLVCLFVTLVSTKQSHWLILTIWNFFFVETWGSSLVQKNRKRFQKKNSKQRKTFQNYASKNHFTGSLYNLFGYHVPTINDLFVYISTQCTYLPI